MAVNLLFVNIRSIKERKLLFQHLLLEEKVDIFLLNETALKPQQEMRLPGYQLLRHDFTGPGRARGGVMIGLPRRHPYRQHTPRCFDQLPESLVVSAYLPSKILNIATIYIRPGHPIPALFFRHIAHNFRNVIIMADVNIHSRPPQERRDFVDLITNHLHLYLYTLPRHTRPSSQTTPDVVISSLNISNNYQLQVLDSIGSDHLPVLLTLPTIRQGRLEATVRLIKRYDKADWHSYRAEITSQLPDVATFTSEDEFFSTLDATTNVIQSSAEHHIPEERIFPHAPKLPPAYLNLVRKSRQHFRDYQRTRNEASFILHKQWQRAVKNYLTAYKLRQWIQVCNRLNTEAHPTKYWQKFNQLIGKKSTTTYPLVLHDQPLHTDAEKANAFADSLQDIFTPTDDRHQPQPRCDVSLIRDLQPSVAHQVDRDHPLTADITSAEIAFVLKRKRNTAPGFDGISYRLIKECPGKLFTLLATIFTFILRTGLYPLEWKVSKVCMFSKPNKPVHQVTSYRPIQLTATLGKLFERVLVSRMHKFIAERNILPIHQAGFRPGFSINDQLLRLTTTITNQFNHSLPSCLVLMDLEKAFDKVWHVGLLIKLRRLNFPVCYIRLIYSFLSNRIAYVSIGHALSYPIFPHSGVPQGSALSPLLYILYSADIPSPPRNVYIYQYADDTAFLALGKTIRQINALLQPFLNTFVSWCAKWRLAINPTKTQALVFLPPGQRTKVHRNPNLLHLSISGIAVQPSPTATYLGVIFDSKLNWKAHLQMIAEKGKRRFHLLQRLAGTTWGLKPTALLNTYKAFYRPILTYGHIAWSNAPPQFYERLSILERHVIRLAYRIKLPYPNFLTYQHIDFPTIVEHLADLRVRYIQARIMAQHPLFLATMQDDSRHDSLAHYLHTSLSLLLTLFLDRGNADPTDFDMLDIYRVPEHLPHILP